MRRLLLVLVLVPFTGGGLTAAAEGKKRAKCAHYYEKTGCKLKLGETYWNKSNGARVNVYARGFNISDLVVKNASCADGTKASYLFDVANADTGTTAAVKIGQTQSYTDDTTYILNGEDEVPVVFSGSVTFSSASKASLKGTVTAKLPSDAGPAKECSGDIKLDLKRVIEKR